MRLLEGGVKGDPVLQHTKAGVTTWDEAVDALMERVYGPLAPGQQRERW